jgi:nitrogen fixation/metabolism regulation signal transduction histidine kinase
MNILKSATQKYQKKKEKKKGAQNFFIFKYVIKHFKTSKFYYQKVLI